VLQQVLSALSSIDQQKQTLLKSIQQQEQTLLMTLQMLVTQGQPMTPQQQQQQQQQEQAQVQLQQFGALHQPVQWASAMPVCGVAPLLYRSSLVLTMHLLVTAG
jgi:hypothetical protein